ncbi:hypothetical protein CHRY9390_03210 [Chryseobacterium aquaeductus]|uniref:Uncharacterized protein n=1 Tax=Chryseobacterium aquaeductus TaxID=2675056 RepID=A0A9N8QTJ9_9FLAO|nr:hypothetical protein [Chryseobacterium aquaeductus]CAA7332487.1 hypothetical protein CHRY9390_03210 [Chryseobacterium potabilaquae]CAD7816641.1 hypothetical protein CHRY9390_03210 [Chryseobacterium aquaeductus]
MKKKVFKYKFVYWVALLVNVIFLIAFGFGIYNRVFLNSVFDIYSIIIFIIAVLSVLSFILLIKKNKLSILTFSISLVLISLTIAFSIIKAIFEGHYGNGSLDYIMPSIIYSILFSLLFLIIKFKSKNDYFQLEIDQIGQKEE